MNGPQEVSKSKAIEILNEALEQLSGLQDSSSDSLEFMQWKRETEVAIKHIFGEENDNVKAFNSNRYTQIFVGGGTEDPSYDRDAYHRGLVRAEALLQAMITEIERFWE